MACNKTGDGYAVFSVAAEGNDLSYQWQYSLNRGASWYNSSSAIQGYNTNTLTIQATEARAGNLYRCRITDINGESVISDPAQIDLGGVYSLAILSNPRYYSGNFGETATFAVTARGENITYQWQYNNGNGNAWWNSSMTGSATPSMTVQLTEARQNYLYRCKITDAEGNTRHSAAAGFYLPEYTWEFTYNSDGMRTGRTDGETTYSYVYNGSQLSQMTVGSSTLSFAYGANGKPMTVTLNGTVYYYSTNLQGDVTGIWDASGSQVASYTYDAWGNVTVVSDHTLATLNPLTYRGYVYDAETGLYYLQSRYYDPEMGRFINADSLISTAQGLLGTNIFAYCFNNPVCYSDYLGQMPTTTERDFLLLLESGAAMDGPLPIADLLILIIALGYTFEIEHVSTKEAAQNAALGTAKSIWNPPENTRHHILKGTKGRHIEGWKRFGVDPDDGDDQGWNIVLPILQEVFDKADDVGDHVLQKNGTTTVEYIKTFIEQGVQVVLKMWYTAQGIIQGISDAIPRIIDSINQMD